MRGRAIGICGVGSCLGAVVSFALTPLISAAHGWRTVFWLTGMLGFGLVAIWKRLMGGVVSTEAERSLNTTGADAGAGGKGSGGAGAAPSAAATAKVFGKMLTRRPIVVICFIHFCNVSPPSSPHACAASTRRLPLRAQVPAFARHGCGMRRGVSRSATHWVPLRKLTKVRWNVRVMRVQNCNTMLLMAWFPTAMHQMFGVSGKQLWIVSLPYWFQMAGSAVGGEVTDYLTKRWTGDVTRLRTMTLAAGLLFCGAPGKSCALRGGPGPACMRACVRALLASGWQEHFPSRVFCCLPAMNELVHVCARAALLCASCACCATALVCMAHTDSLGAAVAFYSVERFCAQASFVGGLEAAKFDVVPPQYASYIQGKRGAVDLAFDCPQGPAHACALPRRCTPVW